jgi:hypothetical protein
MNVAPPSPKKNYIYIFYHNLVILRKKGIYDKNIHFSKKMSCSGDFSPKKRIHLEEGILGEGIVF